MNADESGRDSRPHGLLGSLRRLLASLIALLHTRLELLTTEVEEQIQRAAGIVLWTVIGLYFASLTVVMLAILLLVIFWDDHRVLTAALITAAFFLVALIAGLIAYVRLKTRPRLLAATIEELKRDRAALDRM